MDRMRRLRKTENIRRMVRENHVRRDELIYPIFVIEEKIYAILYRLCRVFASIPLTGCHRRWTG